MKKLPDELKDIVSICHKHKFEDAFEKVREIDNIPSSVSKWFYDQYAIGGDETDMKGAFKNFYEDVRNGKYVLESELSFFKKIIKEELINESIEKYISAIKSYDWYYSMSDNRKVYNNGLKQSQKIKDIYNNLSDSEKRTVAIWFRDYFIENDLWSDTDISRAIHRWRPETDFNPDKFNGTMYRE